GKSDPCPAPCRAPPRRRATKDGLEDIARAETSASACAARNFALKRARLRVAPDSIPLLSSLDRWLMRSPSPSAQRPAQATPAAPLARCNESSPSSRHPPAACRI